MKTTKLITKLKSISLILISSIFFSLLISCGGSNNNQHQESSESYQEPIPAPVKATSNYYINSSSNEGLAEIIFEHNGVIVRTPKGDLFGELKGDKRKYYNQNDQFRNAVKFKEGSFKLRDENEELLWKVKIYDDKIKLANNEEMTDPFDVRFSDSNKIKVKKNGEEIAALRMVSGDSFVNVGDNYVVRNFDNSLAIGILLIDDIQQEHKFLLAAEILKMGR